MSLLRVEIPLHIPSVANLREHWSTKAKRTKSQRNAVVLARHGGGFLSAIAAITRGEPLVCTLTRIGRKLDDDNLASAFKAVRDQVAEELGVDDGSDAVAWRYAQEKGKAGIRIEIERAALAVPEPFAETMVKSMLRMGREKDRRALVVGGLGGVNFEVKS